MGEYRYIYGMYHKQLYKTAIVSSPIIALYGIAPVIFITKFYDVQMNPQGSFLEGWLMLTIITLLIWSINFYVISRSKKTRDVLNYRSYILSYILVTLFTSFTLFISGLIESKREIPVFLPFIIGLSNNTIILIICDSIISRSHKAKVENELAILKVRSIEADHQQLIKQLQPHFLFNALSTLKSLIKSNPEIAEEYLIKLSDFLRYTVSSHNNKLVFLSEELQFTRDYILLQKIRFENSFYCKITIPEEITTNYYIPVYALQILVENAIKHNAFTEEHPLFLNIDFQAESLVITNNKIAKPGTVSHGVGLRNLSERYLLNGGERIDISDEEKSFSVTIKLLKKS